MEEVPLLITDQPFKHEYRLELNILLMKSPHDGESTE